MFSGTEFLLRSGILKIGDEEGIECGTIHVLYTQHMYSQTIFMYYVMNDGYPSKFQKNERRMNVL